MTVLSITDKGSGYLIDQGSHYRVNQWWYEVVINSGLMTDLDRVMKQLNKIEDWLGISRTTWSDLLGGNPKTDADYPHYVCNIGGDTSNVGTLREAVDRLRSEGEEPAWEWYFVPTLSDYYDNPCSHRNVLSNFAILELFLAIGRLVNDGESGSYSSSTITFVHIPHMAYSPHHSIDEKKTITQDTPWATIAGEHEGLRAFDFHVGWGTQGQYYRQKWLRRDATDAINVEVDQRKVIYPGVRTAWGHPITNPDWYEASDPEMSSGAYLTAMIFRNDNDDDADSYGGTEAIEDRHPTLWHYHDYEPPDDEPALEFELGDIQNTDDSYAYAIFTGTGPYTVQFRLGSGGQPSRFENFGDFDVESGVWGVSQPTQYNEATTAPLMPWGTDYWGNNNLQEVWYPSTVPLYRHPWFVHLWEHAENLRNPDDYTLYPDPSPVYVNGVGRHPTAAELESYSTIGDGHWRHSDKSPTRSLTDDDVEIDWTITRTDEEIEELYDTILDRMRNAANFTPGVDTPKKYMWVWVDPGYLQIPNLGNTFIPGQHHIPSTIYQQWNQKLFEPDFDDSETMDAKLRSRQVRSSAHLYSTGGINALRKSDCVFPFSGRTGSYWLVWDGMADDDGTSPMDECAYRY